MQHLIDLARENPKAAFVLLLPLIIQLYRTLRANLPAPTPGSGWAKFCTIVDAIVGVIPTAKVDAIAKPKQATVTAGVIRDHATGEILEPDLRTRADLVGFRPFQERRQKRLRAAVRQIAAEKWLNPTDAQIDAALADIQEDMKELSSGPLLSLLQWIIANPQVILAILSLFMAKDAEAVA